MVTKEQFAGCLLGQCLGDALGFMVEGRPAVECAAYVDDMVRTGRVVGMRRGPFAFGQYSDDSQLARELLESFVDHGRLDCAAYAARIAAIFAEDRIVGRGRATEEAAVRLQAGVPWTESGTPSPAAGNGSAMRAAPIGLFFYDDFDALALGAYSQGRITHLDPRCAAGAAVIAASVAQTLLEPHIVVEPFLHTLSVVAAPFDTPLMEHLLDLVDWLALDPKDALPLIAEAGVEAGFDHVWDGISPYVVGSVLWSLYAFLRTPDDYFETICTAIAVGGDVDTTAAMAGAISGAHNGMESLPQELLKHLNDQGAWTVDELIELAHTAHEIRMHPRSIAVESV